MGCVGGSSASLSSNAFLYASSELFVTPENNKKKQKTNHVSMSNICDTSAPGAISHFSTRANVHWEIHFSTLTYTMELILWSIICVLGASGTTFIYNDVLF